ncbi:MAG: pyridoxamine 5'-phosphate oxidase family protein [Gammaproteobacteria bacterium]|nr:pyridoxamine 5'-phosphate oxidase family protein [Gammaproteobacteria bacterium]
MMKIETQNNAELIHLGKLIENISVAMFTTLDDKGALVSRPMSPLQMDETGALWFSIDIKSAKLENLRLINLSFADISRSTFVSLSGYGEVTTDRTKIDELWTPFLRPWFPQGPDSPNLGLLKFLADTGEYWDAAHSKMIQMFTMAASIIAANPIGMGEHETLTNLALIHRHKNHHVQ